MEAGPIGPNDPGFPVYRAQHPEGSEKVVLVKVSAELVRERPEQNVFDRLTRAMQSTH